MCRHSYPHIRGLFLLFMLLGLSCAQPQTAMARDVVKGPVRGTVLRVLDGDTVAVRLHIWIGQDIVTHVRIAGIDAPELHGKCRAERTRAYAAKKALAAFLSGNRVDFYNVRFAKYGGRVLAEARTPQGQGVAHYMLERGFARPYYGEKRKGWCD